MLYTTLGMPLFALDDVELQQICFSVFNNWLGEYAAYAPKRLYPIALISLDIVAVARSRVPLTIIYAPENRVMARAEAGRV